MIEPRFGLLQGLRALPYALAALSIGCSTSPAESTGAVGYKYHTLIRDSSGKYRNADVLSPGDIFVYQYGIRWKDLVEIDKDLSVAAKVFIERRHGAPPECTSGIKIVKIIRGENGGVAANVECI
jgi:hypothetical protein